MLAAAVFTNITTEWVLTSLSDDASDIILREALRTKAHGRVGLACAAFCRVRTGAMDGFSWGRAPTVMRTRGVLRMDSSLE